MAKAPPQKTLTPLLKRRLLRLRDEHALTDAAWARLANVRQQDVSRYTRGIMTYPTLEFLERLCLVFDTTLGDLLTDTVPRAPTFTKAEWLLIVKLRELPAKKRRAFEILLEFESAHPERAAQQSPSKRRTSSSASSEAF